MAWQFTAQQPIYRQIVDALEMRIVNGSYGRGERLPSVRDLALEAAVNPNTMQRALSELEHKGLVTTQRTSGRTVTDDEESIMQVKQERAASLAASFVEEMRALGFHTEQILALIAEQAAPDDKEDDNGNDA